MEPAVIGIVVPTLGNRPQFIEAALRSVRAAGAAHVCVVAPPSVDLSAVAKLGLVDQRVDDNGMGLAAAIDSGIRALPPHVVIANWLGDDDLLEPGSFELLTEEMRRRQLDFVWGGCRYVDANGREIWTNRSGRWAALLIRFGPNLIPQPGALFSRTAFEEVGGLDTRFGWAFDQDLFTKFVRGYRVGHVTSVVASFRWHGGSLSAGARSGSVRESSAIRVENLPRAIRPFSSLWEVPIRFAISYAGRRMNRRSVA